MKRQRGRQEYVRSPYRFCTGIDRIFIFDIIVSNIFVTKNKYDT